MAFGAIIVAMGSRLPGPRRWRTTLSVSYAALALLCAACGSSGSSRQPNGPDYQVTTESIDGLGTVLVNGKGYALYLYEPDHQSSRSTCVGPCAINWPPLLLPTGVTKPLAGAGVQRSLLGVTTRSNGTTQVTYNGWPLYRWAHDSSPGEATGEGIYNLGGLWYVVSPLGNAVKMT
jgi:predicted lipoprotein with Yx(FWY)xxD motif